MRTPSLDFKTAMKAPIKEVSAKLVIDPGVDEITNADDLVKYTIEGEAPEIGKSVVRRITGEYLGNRNLVGTVITAELGVKLAGGTIEYMSMGKFLVTQCETIKDKEAMKLTGFDLMIYTSVPYQPNLVEYPSNVNTLLGEMSTIMNLPLASATVPNGTIAIADELYENISDWQFRNTVEEIAQISGSVAVINEDNELAFRSILTPDNTVEEITYAELMKCSFETEFGDLNSLVLSRQPQEDNVVVQDETSVATNGTVEFKIVNNQIIDKDRETIATDIFAQYDNIQYYPFKAETVGLGWFEIGDKLNITDDEPVTREVRVLGHRIEVDGGIKETIWSSHPTPTETNYARAGGIERRFKNTEIIVDKQQQDITSIVEQVDTLDGVVNDTFTSIEQDITNIISTVQQSGGSNKIQNSAFFSYNTDNEPDFWTNHFGAGQATFFASPEAVSYGSLSGHVVLLDDFGFKQVVSVVEGNPSDPEDEHVYYSFACRVKKETVGVSKVKLTDGINVWEEEMLAGTSKLWEEIKFQGILPESTTLEISIEGDASAEFEVTDMMLSTGEYNTPWQQANGEIMNTQVNIHSQGIIVKSSVFEGDYTVISPLEFSGYAKIGGVNTKVFTLNKDVTEVKKLQATDEITMNPIKIVPLNNATQEGWAFVGTGEGS